MSGLKGSVAGLALAAAIAGAQAEEPKVATLGNDQVAATTQAATQRLMVAVDTTLIAQAAPPESDGKEYFADVLQVDGSKKRIKYYRYKNGSILPPPVVDWKLVDGSPAPEDDVRARIAQRKVLVPYDKNAQIALAVVGDRDLMKEAWIFIKTFWEKVESWGQVSKPEFEQFLFHTYIYIESWSKWDWFLKVADHIAIVKLKLTPVEYNTLKSDAQGKAKKIWKSTTGAVA